MKLSRKVLTKEKGVSNGTVHNIQKSISAFLNWAHTNSYHENLDFKKWDTKKPKTVSDVVDLLMGIEEYKDAAKKGNPPNVLVGSPDRKVKTV